MGITTIEDIYLHSLPIKEFQIVDILFPAQQLKDDVMKIMPVQKQTSAGQNSRFVCYVAVGDSNGHIGLGSKCAKEVATAIRGGIIAAKLNLIPVRRGLLLGFLRPHEDARKLHQGNLRCPEGDLRVPHAGPLEADAVRQDAVPGVLGPPAADEDEGD